MKTFRPRIERHDRNCLYMYGRNYFGEVEEFYTIIKNFPYKLGTDRFKRSKPCPYR